MIKLFRQIRQRMIKENKMSKYLLYAIGEIILVVIGILIALQLNEWSGERKDEKQEVKILLQLNNDLRANLEEVIGINEIAVRRSAACDSIMSYIAYKRPLDDSLKLYLERLNMDGLFNNANTTYSYIQSQGTNFLTNDTLRARITSMYERDFQNIFSRESMSWQIVVDNLRPIYERLLTVGSTMEFDFFSPYTENTPKDMELFYQDEAFQVVVARMRAVTGVRTWWLAMTLDDLEELIEDIDLEIKKLSH
jgi:hypothetical protein